MMRWLLGTCVLWSACLPAHPEELISCDYPGEAYQNSHYVITSTCWEEGDIHAVFSGKIPTGEDRLPVNIEVRQGPPRQLAMDLQWSDHRCTFRVRDVVTDVMCESQAPFQSFGPPTCTRAGQPASCTIELRPVSSKLADW
jgi:hypothetical protein